MSRTTLRIALFAGALVWPFIVMASTPANVTGLSAHFSNGQITVRWNAPENAGELSTYRIYYGQKSILSNDGAYDDFETTSARNNEFIMVDIPAYSTLFFGVLAVNKSGEESASFVEEVELPLSSGDADGQSSSDVPQSGSGRVLRVAPSPSRKQREATTAGLVNAMADGPDTVRLMFTMPVIIPVEQAAAAFTVTDATGKKLALRRLLIDGATITLVTDPQVPGRMYTVNAGTVIAGQSDNGAPVPMDTQRSSAKFTGFGATEEAVAPPLVTAQVIETVTTPETQKPSDGLPPSGLPILGIAMAGGAVTGIRWARKRFSR